MQKTFDIGILKQAPTAKHVKLNIKIDQDNNVMIKDDNENSKILIETNREHEILDSLRDNRFNKDNNNKNNNNNKRHKSKINDQLDPKKFEKLEKMLLQSECLNILENASKNIKIVKEENFFDKFLNIFKPNLCGSNNND